MNSINKVNPELKKYIEGKIFPIYKLNGESHGQSHIEEVIKRTFEIVEEYENNNPNNEKLNHNLLYIIAAYHDIGDHIDRKKHHIISGKIMYDDKNLDKFLSLEEKQIGKEAIEDHRASNSEEPRSIYGKVVLTADRNNKVEDFFKRRIQCCMERHPEYTESEVLEEIYNSALEKFGTEGYAFKKKAYMPSEKLKIYLNTINKLLQDKDTFDEIAKKYLKKIKDKKIENLCNSIELPKDLKKNGNDKPLYNKLTKERNIYE